MKVSKTSAPSYPLSTLAQHFARAETIVSVKFLGVRNSTLEKLYSATSKQIGVRN